MLRIWFFLIGYVIISIEGYMAEKFINIAFKRGIHLTNINRIDKRKLTAKIKLSDFRKLRPIAFKSKCKVRIVQKEGLPFVLKRYRNRKFFVVGFVIFAAIIIFLSTIVWTVEIETPASISSSQVMDCLRSMGIYPGVVKSAVDRKEISETLMLKIDNIAFAGVQLNGTRLTIKIVDRRQPPKIIPSDTPCDIIATKYGIIESVEVRQGTAVVKPGDTVMKGQKLVSAATTVAEDPRFPESVVNLLHAQATVKARTWYEAEQLVEMVETRETRTGSVIEDNEIDILGIKINLFKPKINYSNYDTIKEEKMLNIAGIIQIPVMGIKTKYYETNIDVIDLDSDKAAENAINAAYKTCLEQIPDSAVVNDVKTEFVPLENGGLLAKVSVECIEDIGCEADISQ